MKINLLEFYKTKNFLEFICLISYKDKIEFLAQDIIKNISSSLQDFHIKKYFLEKEHDIPLITELLLEKNNIFSQPILFQINFLFIPTKNILNKLFAESINSLVPIIIATPNNSYCPSEIIAKNNFLWLDLNEKDLVSYIKHKAQIVKLEFSPHEINSLFNQYKNNPIELQQYFYYCELLKEKIKPDSINFFTIYNLSNAYLSGDLRLSLEILNYFHDITEFPLIIWLINEDIKKILLLKDKKKLAEDFYFSENLIAANKRISYNKIINILQELSLLDLMCKGEIKSTDIEYKIQLKKIIVMITTTN